VDVRVIADVETMRALADPTRVAIVRLLMSGDRAHPPIMSAKEIAAALQESQVRLYRHLKHLTSTGLIRVAETRLVSGIQEQRYRTGQLHLTIGGELLADEPALTGALDAMLDDFRASMTRGLAQGRVAMGPDEPLGLTLAGGTAVRVSPGRAAEFRSRLQALLAEYDELGGDDPDGVTSHLLVGWYTIQP
jgi:DNA-binding transcriptional ArsR family regulator